MIKKSALTLCSMGVFLLAACGDDSGGGAALCDDGTKNGTETDVAGGGGLCVPCLNGSACLENDDCESGICRDNVCTEPQCDDGLLDGSETDVDCGGGVCDPCALGMTCLVPGDCESSSCVEGLCVAADCSDGQMNGDETDADCGGPDCAACTDGQGCAEGSDCASGVCDEGVCQAPRCGDGVVNGEDDCDDGGESAACNADCTLAECGDGYVNSLAGEACDEGAQNGAVMLGGCSEQCQPTSKYELVMSMDAAGTVTDGSWSDAYERVVTNMEDCVLRFDNRIATARHIEYDSDRITFDFQPLHAWYNGWDAYAYIDLVPGTRAGIGASYRRGHAGNVWMHDRDQHGEMSWNAMDVSLYCKRQSAYSHVASFDAAGTATDGSWTDLYDMVTQRGARCKVRYDNRISLAPHVEYTQSSISFDFLGLQGHHDTSDAYAYINVINNTRAGLGSSYRSGLYDTVWEKDRAQFSETSWQPMAVDVFCKDVFTEQFEIDADGVMTQGSWAGLQAAVVDEMRDCRLQYDDRVSDLGYVEYSVSRLEFSLMNLHAWFDDSDAYAAVRLTAGVQAQLTGNYHRGNYSDIWKKAADQHAWYAGGPTIPVTIHCEPQTNYHHALTLDGDGNVTEGAWSDFYDTLMDPTGVFLCRTRQDGRIMMPGLIEHGSANDSPIYLDMQGLAAYHDSWEAYATVVLSQGSPSGLSASYRRGHADVVWERDRQQHSLGSMQPHPVEVFCQ